MNRRTESEQSGPNAQFEQLVEENRLLRRKNRRLTDENAELRQTAEPAPEPCPECLAAIEAERNALLRERNATVGPNDLTPAPLARRFEALRRREQLVRERAR